MIRKVSKREAILVLVGLIAVALLTVGAMPASSKYFEVIDEHGGDEIRTQLNEIISGNQSCSVVATVPAVEISYGKPKIILECTR